MIKKTVDKEIKKFAKELVAEWNPECDLSNEGEMCKVKFPGSQEELRVYNDGWKCMVINSQGKIIYSEDLLIY